MFKIVDMHTATPVATRDNRQCARHYASKLNRRFGAHRYIVCTCDGRVTS
jgi:hypothetical protein